MPHIRESIIPVASPRPLIRLGGNSDGAYLIPDDLTNIEACFASIVGNDKYFEDDLANIYGINSFICHFSTDKSNFTSPIIKKSQKFDKRFLGIKNDERFISLEK